MNGWGLLWLWQQPNMVEAPSWGKALLGLLSPFGVVWLIVIMVIILILSRWNNQLEIKGVDRAVVIARSAVSVFMWFIVVPLVIFILINAFAIANGLGAINIMFLAKWIGLTFSSYAWLFQCVLGSSSVQGEAANYSPDAVIRLIWIFVPLSFIWLRSVKAGWMRWALLPLIIGSLVVTRHKKAGTTFITQDIGVENLQKMPVIGGLFAPPELNPATGQSKKQGLSPNTRKILAGSSGLIMAIGFAVALYWSKRAIGLVVIMVGLGGFLFIAPTVDKNVKKLAHGKDHAINTNIDSLIKELYVFKQNNQTNELYELSLKLNEAFRAQQEYVKFPDSLCRDFKDYFYDRCER